MGVQRFFPWAVLCVMWVAPTPASALPDGALARFGTGSVAAISWSPTEPVLAVATTAGVELLDTASGRNRHLLETNAWMAAVTFDPRGKLVAAVDRDGTTTVWDASSHARIAQFRTQTLHAQCLAFSPDATTLAVGAGDAFELWDTHTWELRRSVQPRRVPPATVEEALRGLKSPGPRQLVFLDNGARIAAVCADDTIRIWDAVTGDEITRYPDASTVTTFERDTLLTWDTVTQTQLAARRGHAKDVTIMALSPDGRLLVSASEDRTALLWDVATTQRP